MIWMNARYPSKLNIVMITMQCTWNSPHLG